MFAANALPGLCHSRCTVRICINLHLCTGFVYSLLVQIIQFTFGVHTIRRLGSYKIWNLRYSSITDNVLIIANIYSCWFSIQQKKAFQASHIIRAFLNLQAMCGWACWAECSSPKGRLSAGNKQAKVHLFTGSLSIYMVIPFRGGQETWPLPPSNWVLLHSALCTVFYVHLSCLIVCDGPLCLFFSKPTVQSTQTAFPKPQLLRQHASPPVKARI